MGTTALPRRKHREQPPSFQERRWLLSGQPGFMWFLKRERVVELWHKYGDIIVARHARSWPFSRPPSYWRFVERNWDLSERDFLLRHPELLLPHEKRALRQRKRRQPATAHRTGDVAAHVGSE